MSVHNNYNPINLLQYQSIIHEDTGVAEHSWN